MTETFQQKIGKAHSLDHFTMERYKVCSEAAAKA